MSTMTGADTRGLVGELHDAAVCCCRSCIDYRSLRTGIAKSTDVSAQSVSSSVDDVFADALSSLFKAQHDLDAVNQQYQAERRRIAAVLATFAASPISASSLQPILDLAAEMSREAQ